MWTLHNLHYLQYLHDMLGDMCQDTKCCWTTKTNLLSVVLYWNHALVFCLVMLSVVLSIWFLWYKKLVNHSIRWLGTAIFASLLFRGQFYVYKINKGLKRGKVIFSFSEIFASGFGMGKGKICQFFCMGSYVW